MGFIHGLATRAMIPKTNRRKILKFRVQFYFLFFGISHNHKKEKKKKQEIRIESPTQRGVLLL